MGQLFTELARRASAFGHREVETYIREIPEFRFLDARPAARAEALDYAVWFRDRTVALAPGDGALSDADLEYIAGMAESRARAGLSSESRRRVLHVHTSLMLREINEATAAVRDADVEELMTTMAWFATQGERGISAYHRGFIGALRQRLPYEGQLALLAKALLEEDPAAKELAALLGEELSAYYAVTVVRLPDDDGELAEGERIAASLVTAHRTPARWRPAPDGGTLSVLLPSDSGLPTPETAARALAVVRDFAHAVGRPCAAGTAFGPVAELADAHDRARRIGRATPLRQPGRLRPHTVEDTFVELAVADAPPIDAWLRTVARQLEPGPDLVATLDAYYRSDMNRRAAAAALDVHPRTLDYRLTRVRRLTGIDPASTRGVRILSTLVARRLAGAWE
jgi:hypothetical protein